MSCSNSLVGTPPSKMLPLSLAETETINGGNAVVYAVVAGVAINLISDFLSNTTQKLEEIKRGFDAGWNAANGK